MAIPILYWMLECTGCGSRRVVRDSYLKFVGTSDPVSVPGAGYGGPPLPERYSCTNGCSARMRAVGSIFDPRDRTMWLNEPHKPIEMDQGQAEEWLRLIREAGIGLTPRESSQQVIGEGDEARQASGKKWWYFWR